MKKMMLALFIIGLNSQAVFATPGEEAYLGKAVNMLNNLTKVYRAVNLNFKMNFAMEVSRNEGTTYVPRRIRNEFVELYRKVQLNMAFIQVYTNHRSSNSEILYNINIQNYIAPLATAVIALNEMEATAKALNFDLKNNQFIKTAICNDYYFSNKMQRVGYYKSVFQAGVERFRGQKFLTYNCN